MVYESGLAQSTQFGGTLNLRPTLTADKASGENAQIAKTPQQAGDTITISPEARALAAPEKGDSEPENPFDLTPEEEERANKLFDELDKMFASGNELTVEQEERLNAIFDELDSIFPAEDDVQLTEDEEKMVNALFDQLDALYANENLSPEQENEAEKIEEKIENIFIAAEERENGGTEAAAGAPGASIATASEDDTSEQTVKQLKEQIEKLEEEIKEIENSDAPEKEKLSKTQGKQAQLMELRSQLLKAQQEETEVAGVGDGGGTRAQGFANSLT